MRFLLKMGFWIALIAFFLPSFGGEESARDVNYLGAFAGAQAALADMGGFCERAPAACEAGRDLGGYVAARVGDGLAYGYAAVQGRAALEGEPQLAAPAVSRERAGAAPGSVPDEVRRGPSPYTPPRPAAPAATAATADPMQTAAIAADRVRRLAAEEPAFAMPVRQAPAQSAAPRPQGSVPLSAALPARPAVPTPAPRS